MRALKTCFHKVVETLFITGSRGCGKSAYAKERLKGKKRIIVLDPIQEYHDELGYILIHNISDLAKYIKANYKKGFKISYNPMFGKVGVDRMQHLEKLAKLIYTIQQPFLKGQSTAKMLLVVEEMNKAYPNRNIAGKMPYFEALITEGRHSGVHLYGINQSAVKVNTNFRDNITEEVLFKQSRRHLAELSQAIGKEYAEKAIKQSKHHYIHITDDEVTTGKNKLT